MNKEKQGVDAIVNNDCDRLQKSKEHNLLSQCKTGNNNNNKLHVLLKLLLH